MLQPSKKLFQIILVSVVLATHIYAALTPPNSLINWFKTDDAFYYFKTAINIVNGQGPTFDGIGLTNGFHPLWMLICLPVFLLARIDLVLPLRGIIIVLGLIDAAAGLVLFRMASRYFSPKVSMLLALFWALGTSIHSITTMMGMESGINALFLLLLLDRILLFQDQRKNTPAGWRSILGVSLVAVLALLSRLDNIFLIGVLGFVIVFDRRDTRLLALGDLLIILFSTYASYLTRLDFSRYYYYMPYAIWMAAIGLLVKPVVLLALRLYDGAQLLPLKKSLLRLALGVSAACALQTGLIFALIALGLIPRFPRSALLVDWAISLVLMLSLRLFVVWRSRAGGLQAVSPQPGINLPWKRWLTHAAFYYGPILLALALYMGFNEMTLGTSMPVSGQIKRWWGTIYTVYGRPADSFPKLLYLGDGGKSGPWSLALNLPNAAAEDTALLFTGQLEKTGRSARVYNTSRTAYTLLAVVGLLAALLWGRRHILRLGGEILLLPWLAGCLIHTMSYSLTGYIAVNNWYWVPEMILVVLLLGVILESLSRALSSMAWVKPIKAVVFVAMSAFLIAVHVNIIATLIPYQVDAEHAQDYLGGVTGLLEATEPGSVIGSTGGGTIGYFIHDRTIVNLDGLINSNEYFQLMQAGRADEYLDRIGLDYVYGAWYILNHSEPYKYMFDGRMEELGEVAGSMLFRYHPIPITP